MFLGESGLSRSGIIQSSLNLSQEEGLDLFGGLEFNVCASLVTGFGGFSMIKYLKCLTFNV